MPNTHPGCAASIRINEKQLQKITHHVEDAERSAPPCSAADGHVRTSVRTSNGPTIPANVREGMAAYAEETFGPVVSLYPGKDEDEAIAKANDSDYGLNFSVWTSDGKRGRRVATQLQGGSINVNEAYAAAWTSVDAPMGGMKTSGVGHRHGEHGILKYTESQTITTERVLPLGRRHVSAPTYTHGVMTTGLRALRRVPGVK